MIQTDAYVRSEVSLLFRRKKIYPGFREDAESDNKAAMAALSKKIMREAENMQLMLSEMKQRIDF